MKTSALLTLLGICSLSHSQTPSIQFGTNVFSIVFQDTSASQNAKTLFLSDLSRLSTVSGADAKIVVSTNIYSRTSLFYNSPSTISFHLDGLETPKFTNGNIRFPTSLSCSNGVFVLNVPKSCTDAYASLCSFEFAYSNEIAKLRNFIANDLAAERLASLSDDDIYEMYLSKQWEPGNRNGPSLLPAQNRPQILRGIYYQPPVAAVLSWPMGPSDAPEHLWAQINVRVNNRVYETRAIYYNNQWWLTIWDWEEGDPVWTP